MKLTSLDISDCTFLRRLYCYDNLLTSLDISQCPDLQVCQIDYNPGEDGVFVVKSWFDNDNVPEGIIDPNYEEEVYKFPKSWTMDDWSTVTVDYQKVI